MKKTIVVAVLLVAAATLIVAGTAFAQGPQPPVPGGRGTGMGVMHEYMEDAMAAALGLTPAEFEARRLAGETAYQIALAEGISADKIPALLTQARSKALDAASAAGVIATEQAQWMKSRGGYGAGNCMGGASFGGGMMGGGGRWQQPNP